jgi:hypothetical protein
MRLRILLVLLLGCGRGASSPPPPKVADAPVVLAPPADAAAAAPLTDDCAKLTRAECLDSDACTLHLASPNRYQCRADANACEIGIKQQDQKACTAKAGCTFTVANCYCECPGSGNAEVPDVVPQGYGCGCACGGGAPALCTPGSTM